VGADTCSRLIDSKYYVEKGEEGGDDSSEIAAMKRLLSMGAALIVIKENGCNFVVGGRAKTVASGEKVFETLSDILISSGGHLPKSIVNMFQQLDESQFRLDLSSTELRKLQAKNT